MINITLQREGEFYRPVSEADLFLMQHCINEDLSVLNDKDLHKCYYIAAAHGWKVCVI